MKKIFLLTGIMFFIAISTTTVFSAQQSSSTTTSSGITVTFTADPVYVQKYSDGIDGVKVNGFIHYSSKLNPKPSLQNAQAGKILVNLIDKIGRVRVVDEIDYSNTTSLVYDKELALNSNLLAIGNSIDTDVEPQPIFSLADAPFTIKIIDTGLNTQSDKFPVATPSNTSSANTSTTGGTSPSASAQNSTSFAADGTQVDFSPFVINYNNDTKQVDIQSYINFSKPVSSSRDVSILFYKSDRTPFDNEVGMEVISVPGDTKKLKTVFQGSVTAEPFFFSIKDKETNAVSEKFNVVHTDLTAGTTNYYTSATLYNGGFAAPSQGTTQVSQTSAQTVSTGPAKGTKVNIMVTDATLTKDLPIGNSDTVNGSVTISGNIVYTGIPTTIGNDPNKIGLIKIDLYDKNSTTKPLKTNTIDIVSNSGTNFDEPISFSGIFNISELELPNGPFTVKVSESNLGITSKTFTISEGNNTNTSTSSDNGDAGGSSSPKIRGVLKNPLPFNTIPEVVNAFVKGIVIPIAIPLLGIAIMYTGFLFVQARGNETKLKEAKLALKWTLIGGAIILASYVIAEGLQATIKDIMKPQ